MNGPRYTIDGSAGAGGPTLPSTLRATLRSRPRGLRAASSHVLTSGAGTVGHYKLASWLACLVWAGATTVGSAGLAP